MCKKGSRCWSDTSARKASLEKRLSKSRASLKAVRAQKTQASNAGDFTAFAKHRKQEETLISRVATVTTELRHNQRDMDGTKTGRKQLETQLAQASTLKERNELQNRIAAAEALRFARQYAYEQETSPRIPLLRIA